MAVNGSFTAVDPDGGSVTFRVTKNPARGEITQGEEGAASFTYTPYENKTGIPVPALLSLECLEQVPPPGEMSVQKPLQLLQT